MMTQRELLDAMGNLASDAEADAMREILSERGITSLADIAEDDFVPLIAEAVLRADPSRVAQ